MKERAYALLRYWELEKPITLGAWKFYPANDFPADSIIKSGKALFETDFFKGKKHRQQNLQNYFEKEIRKEYEKGNPTVIGEREVFFDDADYADILEGKVFDDIFEKKQRELLEEISYLSFFLGIPAELVYVGFLCDLSKINPGREKPFRVLFRMNYSSLFRGRSPFYSPSYLEKVFPYLKLEDLEFGGTKEIKLMELNSAFFWLHSARLHPFGVKKDQPKGELTGEIHSDKRFLMEWIAFCCLCKVLWTREIKQEFDLSTKRDSTGAYADELMSSFAELGLLGEGRNIRSSVLPVLYKYLPKDDGVDCGNIPEIFNLRHRLVHPFDGETLPTPGVVYEKGVKPLEKIIFSLFIIIFLEYGKNKSKIKQSLDRRYFFQPLWLTIEDM